MGVKQALQVGFLSKKIIAGELYFYSIYTGCTSEKYASQLRSYGAEMRTFRSYTQYNLNVATGTFKMEI